MNLPKGFRYAAGYAGIRKKQENDLALIVSDQPAATAAVFTRNRVCAAPVKLAQANLRASKGKMRAILVNAGNANCATKTGAQVASQSVAAAAAALSISPEEIIPASTGVIGVELNGQLIVDKLPELSKSLDAKSFDLVASAIMTTDTVQKTAFAEVKGARIAGMTKGAGMIHPNMATTLAFVLTDAVVPPASLRTILRRACGKTFNRISVDGDQSTNDTLAVLANGASGVRPALTAFETALTTVLESLATQIVRDGEGAKKLVTIDVSGTTTESAAERIARAMANSPLVKTAIAGSDPNWGRLISSAGTAGVAFDPAKVDIDMQGIPVCRGGLAADFNESELIQLLNQPDISIRFKIRGAGKGKARFWTCDFTEKYIEINGSYRT